MAAIKSSTSIVQSRKLAEFLPLETADNVIVSFGGREGVTTVVMPNKTFEVIKTPFSDIRELVPCWSLSALLSVLPNPSLHKTYTGWRCDTYNGNCTFCQIGDTADSPIDTCVAMIEKLHEMKKL